MSNDVLNFDEAAQVRRILEIKANSYWQQVSVWNVILNNTAWGAVDSQQHQPMGGDGHMLVLGVVGVLIVIEVQKVNFGVIYHSEMYKR